MQSPGLGENVGKNRTMARQKAEPIRHNVTPDVVLEHDKAIRMALRYQAEANSAVQLAWKKAKNAGIPIEALKLKIKLCKLDAEDRDKILRDTIRMAKWTGTPIGTQLDLFSSGDDQDLSAAMAASLAIDQVEEEGYRAGRSGRQRSDNPYYAGTENYVTWDIGCERGLEARIRAGKSEEKPASTRRSRKERSESDGKPVNGAPTAVVSASSSLPSFAAAIGAVSETKGEEDGDGDDDSEWPPTGIKPADTRRARGRPRKNAGHTVESVFRESRH